VAQVLASMYSYYSGIGPTTAGYPTVDTLTCPARAGSPSCQYQFFNKNYVLFAYDTALFTGQNFAARDPFYTKWSSLGGMGGLGPAVDTENSVTANSVTATAQAYA